MHSMREHFRIIKEVITKDYDSEEDRCQMVKTRIEIFPDIKDLIDFFEEVPEYDVSMYTHKKMKTTAETSLAGIKRSASASESTGRLQQ